MPKERVKQYVFAEVGTDHAEISNLDVGWDRADTVQVMASRRIGTSTDTEHSEEIAFFLSRTEVNDMIRLLRKARDRTYGQDA